VNCHELSDAYELSALGALDGPEKEAIDEHVARNCETCMKEVNRAVENNAIIIGAVPKLDPPPRLRSRILAGFGLETRPFWVRALPWSVAATAFAVLLLVVVSSARRSNAPANHVASAIDFLATPGTRQVSFGAQGPHGSVLMQQEKGMLLVVVNLPAAPAGKMYETWVVPQDGAPKPVGQLESAKNGDAVGHIPGPLNLAAVKAVAVSVEPAGSHPVTPTQVIFAAPLGS
jgi:anti-sigma-K factor RskA